MSDVKLQSTSEKPLRHLVGPEQLQMRQVTMWCVAVQETNVIDPYPSNPVPRCRAYDSELKGQCGQAAIADSTRKHYLHSCEKHKHQKAIENYKRYMGQ